MYGVLRKFLEDRGFGFIKVIGREDVFVSYREAKKTKGIHKLIEGMRLEFEVEISPAGREFAKSIRVIDDPLYGIKVLEIRTGELRAEVCDTVVYAGDMDELRAKASQLLGTREVL